MKNSKYEIKKIVVEILDNTPFESSDRRIKFTITEKGKEMLDEVFKQEFEILNKNNMKKSKNYG